ncbi:phosphoribosyltransferase [Pseudorhizobium sp. NPDC055634]
MFTDRNDAGRQLGAALLPYAGTPVVLFALARGGVPVALEAARVLGAPLQLELVRKVGLPSPELAMGAVMDGYPPAVVRNENVISRQRISEQQFGECLQRELEEIQRRRRLYLMDDDSYDLRGKTAIVIDDGLATGATMRAAIKGLRARQPERIVVAVPVSAPDILPVMHREADEVVCLETPSDFGAVGMYYRHFPQLTDQEVLEALRQARDFSRGG